MALLLSNFTHLARDTGDRLRSHGFLYCCCGVCIITTTFSFLKLWLCSRGQTASGLPVSPLYRLSHSQGNSIDTICCLLRTSSRSHCHEWTPRSPRRLFSFEDCLTVVTIPCICTIAFLFVILSNKMAG
jgi:hypothetical protein